MVKNISKINIKGKRVKITETKIEDAYIYYKEFNEEVTKFQFAQPFKTLEDAEGFISDFIKLNNKMLNILDKKENFIGSMEVYGLNEEYPEVGIWLCMNQRNKGYAEESLKLLKEYLIKRRMIKGFIYEASLSLIKKLKGKKVDFNKVIIDWKELYLEKYIF